MSSFSLGFDNVVLVVHIVSVIAAFGVVFAYPMFLAAGNSIIDPAGMPLFHRAQHTIIRRLINPGLGVVAASGLLLAANEGSFGTFYVKWGIVAAVALGAITGGYLAPREATLAELAKRDLASEAAILGREYDALSKRVAKASALASAIVVATVLVMVAHT